jgi:hypothetical protein
MNLEAEATNERLSRCARWQPFIVSDQHFFVRLDLKHLFVTHIVDSSVSFGTRGEAVEGWVVFHSHSILGPLDKYH